VSNALKWWQRPVRMMRRDYIGDFAQFMNSDLDQLARESRDRWHINCEWVMATHSVSPDGTPIPATEFFKGKLAGVRIYNRALTPAEVKERYASTKANVQP